jgi:hypothetical protein
MAGTMMRATTAASEASCLLGARLVPDPRNTAAAPARVPVPRAHVRFRVGRFEDLELRTPEDILQRLFSLLMISLFFCVQKEIGLHKENNFSKLVRERLFALTRYKLANLDPNHIIT